jgi:ABC-2 type transport system ATP-binding protein
MDMGLVLTGVTKRFGDLTAVNRLSFVYDKPGVFGLLGTNGAGKTTTIRMILGILKQDEGEITWNGAPVERERVRFGYLPEERGLYPKTKVIDQLVYFACLKGMSRRDALAAAQSWLERLSAGEYRDKPAEQLSKGNQQKIQLMAALISDPELIILDEPLSGLDPVNSDLFRDIIREEIAAGKYIIMSSHQMATVEEFCTDITIMDKSRTVLQGNLNEIKKSYGRVNLSLKVEREIGDIVARSGAVIASQKEFEYRIRVSGEEQANRLLKALIQEGVSIITFDLREPSLHEIFVEKVGHADAQE